MTTIDAESATMKIQTNARMTTDQAPRCENPKRGFYTDQIFLGALPIGSTLS
jgi:hypothetical protein